MAEAKTVIGIGEGDTVLDHAWWTKEVLAPEYVLYLLQQARNVARRGGALGTRGLDLIFSALYGPRGSESAPTTFWLSKARKAWIPDWREVCLLLCVFRIDDIRIYTNQVQWNQNKPAQYAMLTDPFMWRA